MIEAPRRPLDDEIDRVAAKLVALPGDNHLMERVMSRLPERAARPWYLAMPGQLAAGAALVLVAFLYARPSPQALPMEQPPVATAQLDTRIPDPGSRIRAVMPPVARRPTPGRAAVAPDRPDHERSLAPVDAIESLELSAIGAPALEFDAAAALEPLVLTELLLASDPSSPWER